jgi:phage tail sheath protein FI
MPTKPSYPGVYVEEISSSSQAITPASTATAAFVGYTRRGPLNEPVRVTSFAEYERHFGGLTRSGAVGYAAHQFFGNGGASAVIVRVIKEGSATAASVTLDSHERHEHEERGREERAERAEREREGTSVLEVHARAPGHWGNGLRIAIDYATRNPHETFNLHVFQVPGRPYAHESFHGLSMDPDHRRYAPAVIDANSALIRGQAVGEHRPDPSGTISKPFDYELPDLDVDIRVRIGEVEREFHLYHPERDGHRPRNLFELAALLERKLRAQQDRPGRHAFAGAEVRVLGRRLQTVAGSLDEDDVLRFQGEGAADLGLEAFANPPASALRGGDDGEPPGPRDLLGDEASKTGIQALRDVDDVNLLNLPDLAGFASTEDAATVLSAAAELCRRRRGFLLIDAPASWTSVDAARSGIADFEEIRDDHAALYFPHVTLADPMTGRPRTVPPGGAVAGVIARTDTERGVWKAPAGTQTRLTGAHSLTVSLTDRESGLLNPLAINALRAFPGVGPVVWGARTLDGTDAAVGEQAGQWAYVPVRRLALHVEESLYRGLRWVVFEPNTEQLWQQIRLDVSAYLDNLFRRGAFAGRTPREAYFVRCDATTTTQAEIANGIVNVVVGIAPVTPAEFVVVRIQQVAGRPETP